MEWFLAYILSITEKEVFGLPIIRIEMSLQRYLGAHLKGEAPIFFKASTCFLGIHRWI